MTNQFALSHKVGQGARAKRHVSVAVALRGGRGHDVDVVLIE